MSHSPSAIGFQVYPAIDVRRGRVVRLAQGDYARETAYDSDPVVRAMRYAEAGATWLHLVDLDAARNGGYKLDPLVASIKAATGLRIQTGGGVRSRDDVLRLFHSGADRVVIGSIAVSEPDKVGALLETCGKESLTVALDVRRDAAGRWVPLTHGWTRESARTLEGLVGFYRDAGLRHLLCTDVACDGMLSGPSLALYALLRRWAPGIALQASGGARDLEDVLAARAIGCHGIVLGRAVLEGRLDLAKALAC